MPQVDCQAITSDQSRKIVSLLGFVTLGLAILMAAVPRAAPQSAVSAIGVLLLLAGLSELVVGANAARWARVLVLIGGALTTAAACIVLIVGPNRFFTQAAIVAFWLFGRALVLLIAAFRAPWPIARIWLLGTGIGNALLAILAIVIVLSVSLAYLLFGPWPKLAQYSLIPAFSLLFNGIAFAAAAIVPRANDRTRICG